MEANKLKLELDCNIIANMDHNSGVININTRKLDSFDMYCCIMDEAVTLPVNVCIGDNEDDKTKTHGNKTYYLVTEGNYVNIYLGVNPIGSGEFCAVSIMVQNVSEEKIIMDHIIGYMDVDKNYFHA